MHVSQKELTKYFSAWTPVITIMQKHSDLVDKEAPARPIPIDRVNQTLFLENLYLIQESELCTRCDKGNRQALTGFINMFPGLEGASQMMPFIFCDVCIGEVESLDHFIESRIRIQVAMSLPQIFYHTGYGFPDIAWPRSLFDKPDEEESLILV